VGRGVRVGCNGVEWGGTGVGGEESP